MPNTHIHVVKKIQGLFISLFAIGLLGMSVAQAALPEAGMVLAAMGEAKAVGADQSTRQLTRKAAVFVGDKITTGSDSQVQLRMKDGAVIALGANAEFVVKAYSYTGAGDKKDAAVLSLVQGGLRTISGQISKSAYKMETPTATLGIRGTVFDVYVSKDGTTTVIMREGGVDVEGNGKKQSLNFAGLAAIVKPGSAPTEPSAPPQDVLDYLRGILPNLPDNVTWHDDGRGGAIFDLGEDTINIINDQPPGIVEDGTPPHIAPPIDSCDGNCNL